MRCDANAHFAFGTFPLFVQVLILVSCQKSNYFAFYAKLSQTIFLSLCRTASWLW